jgi:hypothetical protein
MIVLRIEHKVPNFDGWKKAFDLDPIDRKKSGVKRYRVFRPADDPVFVIIDLEFEKMKEAEEALEKLQKLWEKVEGKVMISPETRILEVFETQEL